MNPVPKISEETKNMQMKPITKHPKYERFTNGNHIEEKRENTKQLETKYMYQKISIQRIDESFVVLSKYKTDLEINKCGRIQKNTNPKNKIQWYENNFENRNDTSKLINMLIIDNGEVIIQGDVQENNQLRLSD